MTGDKRGQELTPWPLLSHLRAGVKQCRGQSSSFLAGEEESCPLLWPALPVLLTGTASSASSLYRYPLSSHCHSLC